MQKSRSCEPIAWHEMWHERSVLCLHDGSSGVGKARARGNIETLRSGALRVRVYAGLAPVTKKRHNLIEVVPPGPKAMRKAENATSAWPTAWASTPRSTSSGTTPRPS
jgi:hypothetical protein